MFDKISRSWNLAGECWRILKDDPALLVFPLLSSLAILLLMASFALPVWAVHHHLQVALPEGSPVHTNRPLYYAAMYLFYVVSYSVVMFFNSALISVALKRFDGEPASVREGLQAAAANLPAILGYALIAATVGTILRVIEERVGIIGRIVTGLLGAAWTLATAMTLPVLAAENVGPVEAISRSLQLLRATWGENLIGNAGISLGVTIIAIPVFLLAGVFLLSASTSHSVGAIVLATLVMLGTVLGVALVSATLHSIYIAALYRYATGDQSSGIRQDLLVGAFQQK